MFSSRIILKNKRILWIMQLMCKIVMTAAVSLLLSLFHQNEAHSPLQMLD